MLPLAIVLLFAIQRGAALNPNAVCDGVKDPGFCSEILPMIDSVDPHASLLRLRELIRTHGWPSQALVGSNASNVALTVMERAGARPPVPAVAPNEARIARVWRGRVRTSRSDEYLKYLVSEGTTKMAAIPGNRGVELMRRDAGDGTTEFVVVSYWPSREAIRAFAGNDIEKVRALPHDKDFLVAPAHVDHYDIEVDRTPQQVVPSANKR